jgi:hypothetical protein
MISMKWVEGVDWHTQAYVYPVLKEGRAGFQE